MTDLSDITSSEEHEPVPGLPEELPEGERILWQGSPSWRALARHTFKARWLAFYFAVLIVIRVGYALVEQQGADGALSVGLMTGVFAGGLGFVLLLAWLHARATIYTITTHRVVMRIGVALSMTWNLPFKRLVSADLALRESGDGDVILHLDGEGERARWAHFWPHVQPRRMVNARPALRCIAAPREVAKVLRDAVQSWAARERTLVVASEEAPPKPAAPAAVPLGASLTEARG